MAALQLTYYDPRFKGVTEKKVLRAKLKTYTRASIENAKRVDAAMNDLNASKDNYQFKEMVRMKILVFSNGIYKFNNAPVGATFDSVQVFWNNHPEVRTEAIEMLYSLLKF